MTTDPLCLYHWAFNQGSDARLRGDPLDSCPIDRHVLLSTWNQWLAGWLHCDQHWGELAAPGLVRPLPPVKSEVCQ